MSNSWKQANKTADAFRPRIACRPPASCMVTVLSRTILHGATKPTCYQEHQKVHLSKNYMVKTKRISTSSVWIYWDLHTDPRRCNKIVIKNIFVCLQSKTLPDKKGATCRRSAFGSKDNPNLHNCVTCPQNLKTRLCNPFQATTTHKI